MHNTVWLQMSHSVVCVCYTVAVKAASLSSFVMPLSEGGVALSKEEKCVHVWNQGLERRGGVQACFLFARHLPPFLPPSLPQGQVACIALSHTLPQLQESTHTFFTIYPEPAWVKTACASVSCEDGKESVCDPD